VFSVFYGVNTKYTTTLSIIATLMNYYTCTCIT